MLGCGSPMVLRHHAADLLPLPRRIDRGRAGLHHETGELEGAAAAWPRHAQVFRLASRDFDPKLLEVFAAGRQPHHRRAARERGPPPQVVARFDRHSCDDLIGPRGQLKRDRPNRLVERARVGKIADQLRPARRLALARAQVDDRPIAAPLEMKLDALHAGRRIRADRKQRDRHRRKRLFRRGDARPEGMRDDLARPVEDSQVPEIRAHDAFVHRARHLELLKRVLTAGPERDAVREVPRLLDAGERRNEQERRDQRIHRAASRDLGGTGEK